MRERIVAAALARPPLEPMRDGRMARELERAQLATVGVVDAGLCLATAERVLVGHPEGHVDVLLGAEV